MSKRNRKIDAAAEMVPDTELRKIYSISKSTQDRRDNDPEWAAIGWPVKVKLDPNANNKTPGFRFRSQIETFNKNVLAIALKKREQLFDKLAAEKHNEAAE